MLPLFVNDKVYILSPTFNIKLNMKSLSEELSNATSQMNRNEYTQCGENIF